MQVTRMSLLQYIRKGDQYGAGKNKYSVSIGNVVYIKVFSDEEEWQLSRYNTLRENLFCPFLGRDTEFGFVLNTIRYEATCNVA